ncbi:MAG: fasciclin domain-containing protein [Bacteroidales bacterium]|nr:fasciclin domain-containing protein [Bacteroidales bacterium]
MKSFIKSLSGLLLIAGLSACSNPNWDEHYASHVDETLETTLLEAIEQEPSLSSFLTLLKETGQDKLLSYNQSFTIWAPNNNALSGITFDSDYDKKVFVLNHISRFPYTTSSIDNGYAKIRLLDRKRAAFTQVGSDFYFGENKLISKDISRKNGILHIIDGYVPYVRNIWEFIQSTPGYDSIAQYLAGGEERYFSVEQSTLLTLVDGLAIYDSVFVENNYILSYYIGEIKNEDSIYTMIVPNNHAWTEIMDSLMPYNHVSPYITQRLPNGKYVQTKRSDGLQDSIERDHVKSLIADRLCFYGSQTPERIQSATVLELSADGGFITNPAEYFEGMKDTVASNGLVYMANRLHFPSSLWCSPFQEEAERAWLTYPSNYNTMEPEQQEEADALVAARSVYVRSSDGSWLNNRISNHRYIQVTGNYASARPVVDFNCYNTDQRSTSYHVYVVFLPRNLNRRDMDSAMLLPTKVTFSISYTNPEDGTPFIQEYRTPRTTNPYDIDTMCVTLDAMGNPRPITLPYSRDDITLRISSAVGSSEELKSFITDMYIDAIFFEPVKNE